ncbi:MAG: Gfo/Idh/MocA family oxidoreductase [Lewinellaceae bacterium]|nr:Gfo/Idh/MocA family oxidoreductase [Lewinellaceae bacterium]
MKTLRWGLVGLGRITRNFINDLHLVDGCEVTAVASRSLSKAEEFAAEFGVPKFYGAYGDLFADADVDIVYIGTPHHLHAELGIAAMDAGKHVLCEKPMAVNQNQVRQMIGASKRNDVFLMEALWSRFNPSIEESLDLVKEGAIGEVNYINADFSFAAKLDVNGRLLNMELAGGALLDVGIYPLFLAYSVFGKPKEILATGRFHETGADIQTSIVLKYDNGVAQAMGGFLSTSDMVGRIYGTRGSILFEPWWHKTQGYSLIVDGQLQKFSRPTPGNGFTYEIEECLRCISQKMTESDRWSQTNSLELMGIMDEVRRQIGLKYPFEQ